MSESLHVLVTAVAGDLGQAIVKALRLSCGVVRMSGCDIRADSHAAAFVDSYKAVPPARDPSYLPKLDAVCRELHVCAVIPSSEAEARALVQDRLPCGAVIVGQPHALFEVLSDKYHAMRLLAGRVELGAFADGTDREVVRGLISACGFPLVVKPRRSSGSRNIAVVRNEEQLNAALDAVENPLVQEYFADDAAEFSVGVFRCESFETAIAFRRTLGPSTGLSWSAETVEAPDVCDYALRVARAAHAWGSVNVQVRIGKNGPRLLEVNARFSSLVAARAACGFRDAEWALARTLGRAVPPPPARYGRIRFQRFYHEVIDAGYGFGVPREWLPREILLSSRMA